MSSKINRNQELPLSQIFEQMITNTHQAFSHYSQSSLCKEYIHHRKNIFNVLHKIMMKMGFKSQVFFLSANYLDIIFSSKNISKIKLNIYTLALSCFCLAAKFCEMDPIVPQLQYFIKIYYNIMGYKIKNPITLHDLKYAEVYILKILNYKLNYYTIYDFNSFLFLHGILRSQLNNDNYNTKQIMEKIYKKSRYYLDVTLVNTKLCFKYDALFLSIFILEKSVLEILNKDNNIKYFEQKGQDKFCLKEIIKKYFNINYEKNKQYQNLTTDEETQKIFSKNKNDKDNIYNKKNEEKKENKEYKNDIFTKKEYKLYTNKYNLNFDLNKLKNTLKKVHMNTNTTKENENNKISYNVYSTSTLKNEDLNKNKSTFTSRNGLYNNLYNFVGQSLEKNYEQNPKIRYSKYSYNGNKYNIVDMGRKTIYKKNVNSSVEFKKKDINLVKYILTSQKKRNNYKINSLGKSFDGNISNKNLYHKKLIHQNTNNNYKTISSLKDDLRNTKISYGIIKMKSNEPKREYSIEYNNKKDVSNFLINNNITRTNKLINDNNKTISIDKNIDNINNGKNNKVDIYSRNKEILLNSINNINLTNINNTSQSMIHRTRNSTNINENSILKKLNETSTNILKENIPMNFNIHKYQKNNMKENQILNPQKTINSYKNKLSYALGKQNTDLNNTLKEINIANANNMNKMNKRLTRENILSTLPNKEAINLFKAQKNYYDKMKQDKLKEEKNKNQQDKATNPNNKQHEKLMSSTIVINNNINFNINNKSMNSNFLRNNIYKKNKILNMKTKNYLNINYRNSVNGINDSFYKTHLYTKTLENDFIKKRF